MKLTFLGTAAGESYPAIWCDCEYCTYARKHGGRNLRMNTGTMIDGDVLMDMNSCGFYTAARLGVSLTGVKHLLVTHAHADHLTLEPLMWRRASRGAVEADKAAQKALFSPRFTPLPLLTVYGNRFVREKLVDGAPELFDGTMNAQIRFRDVSAGDEVDAGDGLSFIAAASNHGGNGYTSDFKNGGVGEPYCLNYIVRRGGKTLLYALDAGGYAPDMLDILLSHRYDAVVMEGTFGLNNTPQDGHMNAEKNERFRNLFLEKGCIREDTPFFLTHLAPHWTPPYDIYAPMMARKGFTVAYDGLTAEI